MADERIVAQDTFEQSIKDILTILVNSTYDWQEYTDSEISDILEITDEQAMQLTKILNDQVVANNKLWSSSKTDAEIKNALIESNKYSDELIGKISSISLEYVTTLPTSDIKSNVIYILQGTPNTLNVFNESTSSFVSVGDLNLDLSGYYTSTQVDNLLADKADDNTVVHADAIVADLTTTSGTTVLSSAGLQTELDKKLDKTSILTAKDSNATDDQVYSAKAINTELDKKANNDDVVKKTDMVTTIDSTSTDSQVASAKLLYNELLKVSNDNYIEDANNPTSFICKTDSNTLNTPYKEGLTSASISLIISVARGADSWNGQISISMASSHFFVRNKGADGWSSWVKLITKTDTTTTIDAASTNETIPTAKSVFEESRRGKLIDQSVIDVYGTEIVKYPLGRWYFGRSDLARQFSDMPWGEACIIDITSIIGDANPWEKTWQYKIYTARTIAGKGMYVRQLESRGTAGVLGYDSGWQRVCTTAVADVPKTNLTFPNTTYYAPVSENSCYYFVKNGICYINLRVKVITSTALDNDCRFTGLPKSTNTINQILTSTTAGAKGLQIYQGGTTLNLRHGEPNAQYEIFYSYPVAES